MKIIKEFLSLRFPSIKEIFIQIIQIIILYLFAVIFFFSLHMLFSVVV